MHKQKTSTAACIIFVRKLLFKGIIYPNIHFVIIYSPSSLTRPVYIYFYRSGVLWKSFTHLLYCIRWKSMGPITSLVSYIHLPQMEQESDR